MHCYVVATLALGEEATSTYLVLSLVQYTVFFPLTLNCLSKVVTPPLFLNDRLVNLSGGDVVVPV